ncbi:MAG: hypothetical protein CMF26_06910 [Kiloniella sp.]|nr:hypothetical protein [Kiloniella sp.]
MLKADLQVSRGRFESREAASKRSRNQQNLVSCKADNTNRSLFLARSGLGRFAACDPPTHNGGDRMTPVG